MADATMREQVYKDPRPAEFFEKYYDYAAGKHKFPVYYLAWIVTGPFGAWLVFRVRASGRKNIPKHGPVVIAPNHFSFMDHFLMGLFVPRMIRFMAKSQMFKMPLVLIYKYGGVFPVRRGHKDQRSLDTAISILNNQGLVAMYCEGGRSRSGTILETAKPGIGHIVLRTGATVVPTAIYGSQKARNWKKLRFPVTIVQYGKPMKFEMVDNPTREQEQAVADQILEQIKSEYAEVERKVANQHPLTALWHKYWRWTLPVMAMAAGIWMAV